MVFRIRSYTSEQVLKALKDRLTERLADLEELGGDSPRAVIQVKRDGYEYEVVPEMAFLSELLDALSGVSASMDEEN